jgi:predicted alpha/beta-fold hydrolase
MKSVIKAVAAKGFKIAFVLYRGTGGIPITTSKLYSIKEWRDIKEPADYLYKKHCEN